MASIAPHSVFPGSAAPASATGANAGSSGPNETSGAPDRFMRLVTGMIQGNTTPDQLPSNLAAFLATGDGALLEGYLPDAGNGSDDDDSDELDALSVDSLLAGLQGVPHAMQTAQPDSATGPDDALTGLSGARDEAALLAGQAQEALTEALQAAEGDNGALDVTDLTTPQGTSGLQNLMLAHKAAETAPQAASAEVRAPVGSSGWADELGTHLTMMAANGREAASLRLSPEHLGPLEILISMKDGEASVVFGATNAETRSALEQSLPRLRELFASQGLVLGDANVSRDAPRDAFRPAVFADASRGSSDASSGADAGSDVTPVTRSQLSLVDTYA